MRKEVLTLALKTYNPAAKTQADAAQKKVVDYNQSNPYLEKITTAANAAANQGTFTYDKARPTYTDPYGDKLSAARDLAANFTYEQPRPTYTNRYAEKIDATLNEAVNAPAFSYDAASDPVFQAYQKQYAREGERAVQDAIGKAAAANGGAVSTAGMTAATQAGQYYAGQLTDKIPQLYEQAYNRYLNEYNRKVNNLGLLQGQEATEYARSRDAQGDWESDRNWEYNRRLNALGVFQDADATAYSRHRDTVGDYESDRNWKYGLHQDEQDRRLNMVDLYRTLENDERTRLADTADRLSAQEQTEYDRYLDGLDIDTARKNYAMNLWSQMGYATKEVAEILGVAEGTPTSNQAYNDLKYNTATSSSSSSKGAGEKSVYNALGIPNGYMDYVNEAKKLNDGSDEGKVRALQYMEVIAAADARNDWLEDEDFERMLMLVGLTDDDWRSYTGESAPTAHGYNANPHLVTQWTK